MASTDTKDTKTPTPPKIEEEPVVEVDNRDALEVLEAEAKEWDKDAEIDRILKAFRLDAYAVLGLKPGVPESDIKVAYRKKSLLIHPDKTKNALAPEAFDRLKKAQTELMDEKHRERLDEAIADARMLLIRENKGWTVDSPELKTAEFEKKWQEKTKMVLIENEQRRRRQLKGQMQEEGREQRREEEELEARKRKRQHEQDWEATRDQRIDSWRTFQKGKMSGGSSGGGAADGEKKKKKKKLKPIG
ncbi:DnaJ-like protein subfamily C member 8 [Diplogelasinospora grovesii]|uniref:DnaJ-like protein subfamily C member 8 n=1 Tax=Diplogelasinospora grovesii TaxID=303347 RepID=A0AAN6S9E4_9PEZI|nr:DnaJ-like protein subfamily C member 8 [Diplogelasinospora grovesii]